MMKFDKDLYILSKVFSMTERGKFTTESALYSAATLYNKLIYSSDITPSQQKDRLFDALFDFILVYGEEEIKKSGESLEEDLTNEQESFKDCGPIA